MSFLKPRMKGIKSYFRDVKWRYDASWRFEGLTATFLTSLRYVWVSDWAGALGEWLAPLPFTPEFGVRFPVSAVSKKQNMLLPHPRVKVSIVGSLRDREVACSPSDRQGSNFESCVERTVSSQSSHHPQEVLLAQFSLYVHKGGLKPDSFHLFFCMRQSVSVRTEIAIGEITS